MEDEINDQSLKVKGINKSLIKKETVKALDVFYRYAYSGCVWTSWS